MNLKKLEDHNSLTMIYSGSSMNRTLESGDLLYLAPCQITQLRVGDVIVFASHDQNSAIAHRIISIDREGIRTRGDNSSDIDPVTLQGREILGKVFAAERNHKLKRVHGGWRGILLAHIMRARKQLKSTLVAGLRSSYRRVAGSGALKALIPRSMRPRVVCFSRPTGVELQLMMRSRIIGILKHGAEVWTILPPFRLFVDESSLPSWETPPAERLSPSGESNRE